MKNKVFKIILSISIMLMGVCLITACTHKHTYSEIWSSDAIGHWHQATCDHKDQKTEKENHSFGAWTTSKAATETTTGIESRSCSICKFEETRTIEKQENAHTYSKDWSYDSNNHWHKSTCTHKDLVSNKDAHTFDANNICTTCKYEKINWILEGITSNTGDYLYLSSYSILTPQISPSDKVCDVIQWKILSGTASLEVSNDGSCKITPTKNTKENEKVEVGCTVLSTTKKITLTAKTGTVRMINLDTENNGTINVLSTDAAVYMTGSSIVSEQTTNIKTYSLTLSVNSRNSALDIFITNASILSMDKNSVIKYSGNQKINLHLNNAILSSSLSEYSAVDCTSLELFSNGYCEINGADSKVSTSIGGKAIQSNDLVINAEGTLKIQGGNGFNGINATSTGSAGGNGTVGGTAIHSINVTFKKIPYDTTLSIIAGNGGNGGNGAQGASKSGKGTAGAGGAGGNGADSGYCIQGSRIYFEMNTIQSAILFVSGNGGNGGRGGNGGIGDQAFLTQPANGGNGGRGGNGGTSKSPFDDKQVTLIGGKLTDFQRVIINDLGIGGAGGNGGNGGNVDKDNFNPATGGTGGNGGNGGDIEEAYLLGPANTKFSLCYFSTKLKKETTDKGTGGAAGGTTGNHQGNYNSGSKGYDGFDGERKLIYIIDISGEDDEAHAVD
ncbi:MAG: hypothetical protein K2M08_03135 [Anaeroplasmataceae bacterium]|nr:hypothetical protein [Anaeroplasmataceae bacterium]